MDEAKLLSCPFCGGKASGPTDAWPHIISCSECGASVKGFNYAEDGMQEAVEKWSRRVDNCKHTKQMEESDMTREELENKLIEMAEEAYTLVKNYSGREDFFVSMTRHANGSVFADATIDFDPSDESHEIKKLLDCAKYSDGTIVSSDIR